MRVNTKHFSPCGARKNAPCCNNARLIKHESGFFRPHVTMLDKSCISFLILDLKSMKVSQASLLTSAQQAQSTRLGELLARLRVARKVKQADAALRAGLSRNTAYRLEKGDPGIAVGQVLRYLEAIAPDSTLLDLLAERQPELLALAAREKTQRVRDLSSAELKELDF